MKRYEKMGSIEEAFKFIEYVCTGTCSKCVVKNSCDSHSGCAANAVKYLQQDLNMKPRIVVIDSIEGLEKAFEEYKSFCDETDCNHCRYMNERSAHIGGCFKDFLAEEIEVTE